MIEKGVTKSLEYLLIALMCLICLIVLWQVFTRFILNDPSSFTEELSRYLLIWISLLGGAYITGKKINLAIDLLPAALKSPAANWLHITIHIIIFLFAATVMVYGGMDLVFLNIKLNQQSAALQINMAYIYTIVPLSGSIICFYSVVHIMQEIKKIRK
jgi:TRAP-type C4-dicarboxylate transport system permease small subunit